MKKKIIGILLILISIFTINNVFAEEKEEKVFNGFKAAAGDKITIDENINGSAAIAGETINIDKNINGIAFLASNIININGSVENAILAGNTINIKGNINNDAFIASNYVTISKEAKLARDVFIAASNIDIAGTIERNIAIVGEIVNINDATIKGDITIYASDIVIGNNVTIEGTLKHSESITPTIGEESSINKIKTMSVETQSKKDTITTYIQSLIYSIVGLLVVFIILQVIAPNLFKNITKTTNNNKSNFTNILLIGLGSIIIIPIVSIILMMSSFGFPLSILLLTAYFVIMYLSTIITGYILGDIIYNKIFNKDDNPYAKGAIGIIVLTLLKILPIIGGFINFASIIIGFGITLKLIQSLKQKEEK